MSRKFLLAIAAVAALGVSTLVATDASARGFGGGGGHFGGGHVGGFNRSFHPARTNTIRSVNRTPRTTRVANVSRTRNFGRHDHPVHFGHYRHDRHWAEWCRHHHDGRCGGYFDVGVDGDAAPVDVVADAPAVAATPAAAVCRSDCDYFLNEEPGCYMAKRAFSTPAGDELRCVKICEEPQHAAK
jgi:hypothetical protein